MTNVEMYLILGLLSFFTFLYLFGKKKIKNSDKTNMVKTASNLQTVPYKNDPIERKLKIYKENKLMSYLYEDATTMLDAFKRGSRESEDGQCLGKINQGSVQWLSYKDTLTRIKHFADGLIVLEQKPTSVIGMYAINRLEYIIAEFACYWHSMIIAPIHNTLGPNVCTFVVNQAEIEVVVCDTLERVQAILSQAYKFNQLKHVVVMDNIPYSYISKAKNFNFQVHSFTQVEELGSKNPTSPTHPKPNDVAVIGYTSGTTGIPKGVVLTHENIIACSSGLLFQMLDHKFHKRDVYISYLPLAHIMERIAQIAIFMVGGKVGFYSGNIHSLINDMKIIQPTIFTTVPRLLDKIFNKLHDKVRGNPLREWILKAAIKAKIRSYQAGDLNRNTIWDKLVCNKFRNTLGNRIRLIATGSASLNPRVAETIRSLLGCVLINGYGQTECCSCSMQIPFDKHVDSVGPPLASAIIKLEDIPEMNYYSCDGKGEILVKGPLVTKGYYKNPEETEKLIDKDGWLHTGDVGTWTENGTLQIIDRMKNFFKLAQGEFVVVEKLQQAYSQSPFVAEIFIYGDSRRTFLVAIVVAAKEYLDEWCMLNGLNINFHDQCKSKKVKQAILDDFVRIAKEEKFNKLEYIKRIHLHTTPFSAVNDLLTPTMKLKRFELQKYFSKEIEQLYKDD